MVKYRLTRTCLIAAFLVFVTCIYSSWPQFVLILRRGKIYLNYCEDDREILGENFLRQGCDESQKLIASLLFKMVGFELLASWPAGFAYDKIGVHGTAAIGLMCVIISNVFLVYISAFKHAPTLYAITAGFGANFCSYPALDIKRWYPHHSNFAVSFIVAAQSLSGITAILGNYILEHHILLDYNRLITRYLMLIVIPLSIAFFVSLPSKSEKQNEISTTISQEYERNMGDMKMFLKNLFSSVFILTTILSLSAMVFANYWTSIALNYFGTDVAKFLGNINPTQVLWTLIFGAASDQLKPSYVAMIMFMLFAFAYGFCQSFNTSIVYLCAVLCTVATGYAYSYKFSQFNSSFHPAIYGRLAGICGTLSSLGMLLEKFLTKHFDYKVNIRLMFFGSLASVGISALVSFLDNKNYKNELVTSINLNDGMEISVS